MNTKLNTDHEEAGGQETRHLETEDTTLHHVLQHVTGDEVGEGGEEEKADDGEDEGGEVHCSPGECHQDPGQGE